MKDKKKLISIITLIVGIITLVVGVVFLILHLTSKPAVSDAEYLVEVGSWQEEDAPGVIWTFTEVGKGKLTTNNHENDYDFIWSIEGDQLQIETDWLYTLNNSYQYKIDQGAEVLTLTPDDDSGDINFRRASSVDTEITEDN